MQPTLLMMKDLDIQMKCQRTFISVVIILKDLVNGITTTTGMISRMHTGRMIMISGMVISRTSTKTTITLMKTIATSIILAISIMEALISMISTGTILISTGATLTSMMKTGTLAMIVAFIVAMTAEALMVALEAQMMERLDDYKTAV